METAASGAGRKGVGHEGTARAVASAAPPDGAAAAAGSHGGAAAAELAPMRRRLRTPEYKNGLRRGVAMETTVAVARQFLEDVLPEWFERDVLGASAVRSAPVHDASKHPDGDPSRLPGQLDPLADCSEIACVHCRAVALALVNAHRNRKGKAAFAGVRRIATTQNGRASLWPTVASATSVAFPTPASHSPTAEDIRQRVRKGAFAAANAYRPYPAGLDVSTWDATATLNVLVHLAGAFGVPRTTAPSPGGGGGATSAASESSTATPARLASAGGQPRCVTEDRVYDVIHTRNRQCHAGTLEVSNADLKRDIRLMRALLEDRADAGGIGSTAAAKAALDTLTAIEAEDFEVTYKAEQDVLRAMRDDIAHLLDWSDEVDVDVAKLRETQSVLNARVDTVARDVADVKGRVSVVESYTEENAAGVKANAAHIASVVESLREGAAPTPVATERVAAPHRSAVMSDADRPRFDRKCLPPQLDSLFVFDQGRRKEEADRVISMLIGRAGGGGDGDDDDARAGGGAAAAARHADEHEPPQQCVALRGEPGIGKSSLAAHIARDERVTGHFHEGVFFVKLGRNPSDSTLATIRQSLAHDLRVGQDEAGDRTDDSPPEPLQTVIAGAFKSRRALLIVDDVHSLKHLDAVVARSVGAKSPHVFQNASGSRMLVTCWSSVADRSIDTYFGRRSSCVVQLDVLDVKAATAVLLKGGASGEERVAAQRVAQLVGCLPLLVRGVRALRDELNESYEELLVGLSKAASGKSLVDDAGLIASSRDDPRPDSAAAAAADSEVTMATLYSLLREHLLEVPRIPLLGDRTDITGKDAWDAFLDIAALPKGQDINLDVLSELWVARKRVPKHKAAGQLVKRLADLTLITRVLHAADSEPPIGNGAGSAPLQGATGVTTSPTVVGAQLHDIMWEYLESECRAREQPVSEVHCAVLAHIQRSVLLARGEKSIEKVYESDQPGGERFRFVDTLGMFLWPRIFDADMWPAHRRRRHRAVCAHLRRFLISWHLPQAYGTWASWYCVTQFSWFVAQVAAAGPDAFVSDLQDASRQANADTAREASAIAARDSNMARSVFDTEFFVRVAGLIGRADGAHLYDLVLELGDLMRLRRGHRDAVADLLFGSPEAVRIGARYRESFAVWAASSELNKATEGDVMIWPERALLESQATARVPAPRVVRVNTEVLGHPNRVRGTSVSNSAADGLALCACNTLRCQVWTSLNANVDATAVDELPAHMVAASASPDGHVASRTAAVMTDTGHVVLVVVRNVQSRGAALAPATGMERSIDGDDAHGEAQRNSYLCALARSSDEREAFVDTKTRIRVPVDRLLPPAHSSTDWHVCDLFVRTRTPGTVHPSDTDRQRPTSSVEASDGRQYSGESLSVFVTLYGGSSEEAVEAVLSTDVDVRVAHDASSSESDSDDDDEAGGAADGSGNTSSRSSRFRSTRCVCTPTSWTPPIRAPPGFKIVLLGPTTVNSTHVAGVLRPVRGTAGREERLAVWRRDTGELLPEPRLPDSCQGTNVRIQSLALVKPEDRPDLDEPSAVLRGWGGTGAAAQGHLIVVVSAAAVFVVAQFRVDALHEAAEKADTGEPATVEGARHVPAVARAETTRTLYNMRAVQVLHGGRLCVARRGGRSHVPLLIDVITRPLRRCELPLAESNLYFGAQLARDGRAIGLRCGDGSMVLVEVPPLDVWEGETVPASTSAAGTAVLKAKDIRGGGSRSTDVRCDRHGVEGAEASTMLAWPYFADCNRRVQALCVSARAQRVVCAAPLSLYVMGAEMRADRSAFRLAGSGIASLLRTGDAKDAASHERDGQLANVHPMFIPSSRNPAMVDLHAWQYLGGRLAHADNLGNSVPVVPPTYESVDLLACSASGATVACVFNREFVSVLRPDTRRSGPLLATESQAVLSELWVQGRTIVDAISVTDTHMAIRMITHGKTPAPWTKGSCTALFLCCAKPGAPLGPCIRGPDDDWGELGKVKDMPLARMSFQTEAIVVLEFTGDGTHIVGALADDQLAEVIGRWSNGYFTYKRVDMWRGERRGFASSGLGFALVCNGRPDVVLENVSPGEGASGNDLKAFVFDPCATPCAVARLGTASACEPRPGWTVFSRQTFCEASDTVLRPSQIAGASASSGGAAMPLLLTTELLLLEEVRPRGDGSISSASHGVALGNVRIVLIASIRDARRAMDPPLAAACTRALRHDACWRPSPQSRYAGICPSIVASDMSFVGRGYVAIAVRSRSITEGTDGPRGYRVHADSVAVDRVVVFPIAARGQTLAYLLNDAALARGAGTESGGTALVAADDAAREPEPMRSWAQYCPPAPVAAVRWRSDARLPARVDSADLLVLRVYVHCNDPSTSVKLRRERPGYVDLFVAVQDSPELSLADRHKGDRHDAVAGGASHAATGTTGSAGAGAATPP